jgi:NADH dehydrogenase (ubiquinone) 1 alpha subcomplex subunit 6
VRQKFVTQLSIAPAAPNRANTRLGGPPPEPASSLQLTPDDTFELLDTAKMVINPTYLAQRTRSCMCYSSTNHWGSRDANTCTAVNLHDAKRRVIHSYRDWIRSVRCSRL